MKVSRREFAALVGASGLALPAQDRVSKEALRALLDREGRLAMFDDDNWFELLLRAMELSRDTRVILRSYPLADDAEPAVTLPRV